MTNYERDVQHHRQDMVTARKVEDAMWNSNLRVKIDINDNGQKTDYSRQDCTMSGYTSNGDCYVYLVENKGRSCSSTDYDDIMMDTVKHGRLMSDAEKEGKIPLFIATFDKDNVVLLWNLNKYPKDELAKGKKSIANHTHGGDTTNRSIVPCVFFKTKYAQRLKFTENKDYTRPNDYRWEDRDYTDRKGL